MLGSSATRVVRRVSMWAAALLVLVVADVLPTSTAGAAAAATSPFQASGVVVQDSVNVPPNVDGFTGGFVLGSVTSTYGNVDPAKDSNGNLTIYEKSDTKYYQCDSTGNNCRASTASAVVTQDAHLLVSGRYYIT